MKKITTIILLIFSPIISMSQSIVQLEAFSTSSGAIFEVLDLTVTQEGDKIITGRLNPSNNSNVGHDFDPGPETLQLPVLSPSSGQVGFIASYDKFGAVNYVNQITDADIPPSVVNILIESDDQNNIYVLGAFVGKADLDPGPNLEEVNSGNIAASGFYLASYDSMGNYRFGVQLPNIFNIIQSSIYNNNEINKIFAVDAAGNSYLLVQPNDDEYDFDPGAEEFKIPFTKGVISYDNNGNYRFGYLTPFDTKDLGISPNGTNYISGVLNESFEDTFDFDPSSEVFNLDDVSNNSFFIASYSSLGELNFVNDMKGPNAIPSIITGNNTGDIFIVGKMGGTIDFDPSSDVFNVSVSDFEPDPSGDFFMARYNSTGEILMAKAIQDKINNVSSEVITDMEVDDLGNFTFCGSLNSGVVDFDSSSDNLDVNGGSAGSDIFVASYDNNGEPLFAYSVANSLENFSSIELDATCDFYHLATNIRENVSLEFFQNDIGFNVTSGFLDSSNLDTMLLLSIANDEIIPGSSCDILLVEDLKTDVAYSVWPNPFMESVHIEMSRDIELQHISIIDITGKKIFETTDNLRTLNLEHLENGTYLLSLITENEKATFKIIKQ